VFHATTLPELALFLYC